MTRCVMLSAGGDPFLVLFCHMLFQKFWYDEADTFYVDYNMHSPVGAEIGAEVVSRLVKDPKVHLIYHPRGIGNGRPITEMTQVCREDLVMLLEDDGFIFESGKVNACFQKIESDLCDALGSPRGSCGQEIWDASKKKYGLDYTGYGDVGPNFWPCFFFCKRSDLLKTDLDFGSKSFPPGYDCLELDHTFQTQNYGDTFVWACIQLRAMGLRFISVPQFHASPTEPEDKLNGDMNWRNTTPYWFHGGSLSTAWGGYLSGTVPDMPSELTMMEMETRVAFWKICSDVIDGFDEFKAKYKQGIEDLVTKGQLNHGRINSKVNLYRGLMRV